MTITSPALARQPAVPAGRVRRWIVELVRQRYIDSAPGGVLARTAWDLKLDVARS